MTKTKIEEAKVTENNILVSVDDGYAQTKLYTILPDGTEVKQVRRSSIRSGRWGMGSISGDGFIGLYNTEVGNFTVSDKIESENTQFDDFHTSVLDRVLVNHALVEAELGGKHIDLWTGLPVKDYFNNGLRDDNRISAKRENLFKPVKSGSPDTVMPIIDAVNVGCQAVSAWVDFAMNDQLQLRDDVDGAIAIIDIGGRTTDIATVIGGLTVDHSRSATENIGMLDVYAGLEHGISKRLDVRGKLPIADIDRAIRSEARTIKLWGRQHEVGDIIDAVLAEYEDKLARSIERVIGNGASIDKVIFVGGGSALFTGLLKKFPHNGEIVPDPEFANARGLHKWARYKSQAE